MYEPTHTGISYSFTDDGYYEEAYYRTISNRKHSIYELFSRYMLILQAVNPACPKGMMQWQHGTFQNLANGSLVLTPLAIDGRQLMSDPCNFKSSAYSRYNQSEFFQRYSIYVDPYHQVLRMDMYRFDGSPLPPMYLAYNPPQMLPTSTLNPTTTATGASSTSTSKVKRALGLTDMTQPPLDYNKLKKKYGAWVEPDRWWWIGIGITGIGSFLYFWF